VNFFIPELMKIRWSSIFFGSFAPHFQIKLSIHTSNFNSRFVSMSELELFLLTRVLTPNFNTMDLIKILEKNLKLHIQGRLPGAVHRGPSALGHPPLAVRPRRPPVAIRRVPSTDRLPSAGCWVSTSPSNGYSNAETARDTSSQTGCLSQHF
jgi:hypothetical protein